jgi:hypothetical protein
MDRNRIVSENEESNKTCVQMTDMSYADIVKRGRSSNGGNFMNKTDKK